MNQNSLEQLEDLGAALFGKAFLLSLAIFILLECIRRFVIKRWIEGDSEKRSQTFYFFKTVFLATKPFFTFFIALFIGSRLLYLNDIETKFFILSLSIAFAFQAGLWGSSVINYLVSNPESLAITKKGMPKSALHVFAVIAKCILWAFILLFLLDNLQFDVAALLTGLGIGGIAVALAVQNILGDILASLSILTDKPFVVGDLIAVGEFMGTCEKIGIKTTRIRSLNGELLIFSNSDLLKSRIRNLRNMDQRRVVLPLNLVYQTSVEDIKRIPSLVKELIESVEMVSFSRAHFKEFGASSLDFEVVYYVLGRDFTLFMDKQQEINTAILNCFRKEGLEFAYPTQTILIDS